MNNNNTDSTDNNNDSTNNNANNANATPTHQDTGYRKRIFSGLRVTSI